MVRETNTRQDSEDAVFRSSRRVTFVMRSRGSEARFASGRVSRDLLGETRIDVEAAAKADPPEVPRETIEPSASKEPAQAAAGLPEVEPGIVPDSPPEKPEPIEQPPETAPPAAAATTETHPDPVASSEEPARLRALTSPRGFPDSLQEQIAAALKQMGGVFGFAMLFQVEYVDGTTEYLIGFSGVAPEMQDKVETAVNSVLAKSRRIDFDFGITFLEADDPMFARISRVGMAIA